MLADKMSKLQLKMNKSISDSPLKYEEVKRRKSIMQNKVSGVLLKMFDEKLEVAKQPKAMKTIEVVTPKASAPDNGFIKVEPMSDLIPEEDSMDILVHKEPLADSKHAMAKNFGELFKT